MITLSFDRGTVLLTHSEGRGAMEGRLAAPWRWDERVERWRAPAICYHAVALMLHRSGEAWTDEARAYETLELTHHGRREAHPHQREALAAWKKAGRRGVLVLPTGSGKSYLAELAIADAARSTLILAPTIDLMNQWYDLLCTSFQREVGLIGGGYYDVQPITVTTYDSAWIHMERLGDRFGLIVFDECHHLPGPSYAHAAECALAPFRLGLTATPERSDGRESLLDQLVGPVALRRTIADLAGEFLAEYEVVRLAVELSPEEAEAYAEARGEYQDFVRSQGISMRGPAGFQRFVMISSRSEWGRRAFKAFQRSRQIALAAPSKLTALEQLLRRHRRDRVIIFTHRNDMVHEISRRFLIPAITHHTGAKERHSLLETFREGRLPALVTSRVLNEGVDLPVASVGIVLSGSGSIREHVQRLGRILRRQEGKEAVLYEIITRGTVEERVSERRREHDAYRPRGRS